MEHLTQDQKIACRHSPMAAYLARRLPHLLTWVAILVATNLTTVVLAATFALSPDLMPNVQAVHLMAASLTVLSFLTGIVLLVELLWMRRHGITPDSFQPKEDEQSRMQKLVDDEIGPGPDRPIIPPKVGLARDARKRSQAYVDMALAERGILPEQVMIDMGLAPQWAPTQPEWSSPSSDPRGAVNYLRSQGSDYGRRHAYAEGTIEKEYLRSMEILHFALGDILEAGVRTLDEKKEFGATGSNTGFRQMEMTRECLARINRIASAATRSLWGKRKESEKKRLPKRNCRQ